MRIDGLELTPFLLGSPHTCAPLLAACPLDDALLLDPLAPDTLPFFRLLNAGNQLAFDSLGMPPWVQLDCCTLPTAMIGFALARADLDPSLWQSLVARVGDTFGAPAAAQLEGYRSLVPVAEYCALAAPEPGAVIGFSLFSLLHGSGLGVRAKALALRCHRAQVQIGLTQYGNPAVRVHAAFGPLEILHPRAAPHSRPDDTFVYRLTLVDQRLDELIAGGRGSWRDPPGELEVEVTPGGTADRVAELIATHGRLAVVAPGLVAHPTGQRLTLRPIR